jgi:hypothetical protein
LAVLVGQAIVPAGGFQAAVDTEPATHKLGTHFSGFVSRRHRAAKPEKFASSPGGGLKPACSQDWLPHKKPKPSGEQRSAGQNPRVKSPKADFAKLKSP